MVIVNKLFLNRWVTSVNSWFTDTVMAWYREIVECYRIDILTKVPFI